MRNSGQLKSMIYCAINLCVNIVTRNLLFSLKSLFGVLLEFSQMVSLGYYFFLKPFAVKCAWKCEKVKFTWSFLGAAPVDTLATHTLPRWVWSLSCFNHHTVGHILYIANRITSWYILKNTTWIVVVNARRHIFIFKSKIEKLKNGFEHRKWYGQYALMFTKNVWKVKNLCLTCKVRLELTK